MTIMWAVLLALVLAACWLLTLFTLPGNWLMVLAAALYAWLLPAESALALEWGWVIALGLLALLGEIAELVAAGMGVTKGGGSKRGAVLAVAGSLLGALTGAVVGLPVPIVGSLVAVVVFAALGATGGAMLGEAWKGRTLEASWKVGQSAFWGRLLGTAAKLAIASAMVVVALLGLPL